MALKATVVCYKIRQFGALFRVAIYDYLYRSLPRRPEDRPTFLPCRSPFRVTMGCHLYRSLPRRAEGRPTFWV